MRSPNLRPPGHDGSTPAGERPRARDAPLSGRTLLLGDLSLIVVAVVWGSSYLAMKWTVSAVPILEFLALRFGIGAALLLAIYWRRLLRLTRGEVVLGIAFGMMLFCILSLETTGVRYTTAANAGFIIALSTIFVPIVEGALFRHRPDPRVTSCALISVVGCALLTLNGLRLQQGDVIVLGAACVRAFQMASFRWLTHDREVDSGGVTVCELLVVTGLSAVALSFGSRGFSLSSVSAGQWAVIAYLGALGTAFAFFVQLAVIRRTSAARAGLILSTEPGFAAAFAVGLGGEHLEWIQWIGAALILGAMLLGRTTAAEPQRERTVERTAELPPVPATPVET